MTAWRVRRISVIGTSFWWRFKMVSSARIIRHLCVDTGLKFLGRWFYIQYKWSWFRWFEEIQCIGKQVQAMRRRLIPLRIQVTINLLPTQRVGRRKCCAGHVLTNTEGCDYSAVSKALLGQCLRWKDLLFHLLCFTECKNVVNCIFAF